MLSSTESSEEQEAEIEEDLNFKMGFQWYSKDIRNKYRKTMQYYVTPYTNFDELDRPVERKIAGDLARIVQKSKEGDSIPFIGIAGIPASGKSMLSSNLENLLRDAHGINCLVVSMDGYHYYRSELDEMDDPEEAYARRGAAFTFDSERFVREVE